MVENRAFLYGESLFVTMRIHNSKILFRNRHFSRLKTQIEKYYLGFEIKPEDADKIDSFFNAIEQKYEFGLCRLTIFNKNNSELIPAQVTFEDLDFHISTRQLVKRSNLKLKSIPSPFTVNYPDFKMGSYMSHFYFRKIANSSGYDDILFEFDGNFVESSTSNLLFVKDNKFFTTKDCFYPGLTREVFCQSFEAEKILINQHNVNEFDFAFLINSANILVEIAAIDGCEFRIDHDFTNEIIDKFIKIGLQ